MYHCRHQFVAVTKILFLLTIALCNWIVLNWLVCTSIHFSHWHHCDWILGEIKGIDDGIHVWISPTKIHIRKNYGKSERKKWKTFRDSCEHFQWSIIIFFINSHCKCHKWRDCNNCYSLPTNHSKTKQYLYICIH